MIIIIEGTPAVWPKKEITWFNKSGIKRKKPIVFSKSTNKWKAWKQAIGIAMNQALSDSSLESYARSEALSISMLFVLPKPKKCKYNWPIHNGEGDADNYGYAPSNLLQGRLYPDDVQICDNHVIKTYYRRVIIDQWCVSHKVPIVKDGFTGAIIKIDKEDLLILIKVACLE